MADASVSFVGDMSLIMFIMDEWPCIWYNS